MSRLAEGVFFDATDGEGIIADARHDLYFDLGPDQTAFLVALLRSTTLEEALAFLPEQMRTPENLQVRQALEHFSHTLTRLGFLVNGPPAPPGRTLHPDENAGEICPAEEILLSSLPVPLSSRGPVWQWEQAISPEVFLTGKSQNPPLPRLSLGSRLRAAAQVVRILSLYRRFAQRSWLLEAQRSLQRLSPNSFQELSPELQQRLARNELLRCQVIVRLVCPRGRCVPRSLGLCAYLRALGLPARFIQARARFTCGENEFHAWTEVAERPVNESEEFIQGYAVMAHIP